MPHACTIVLLLGLLAPTTSATLEPVVADQGRVVKRVAFGVVGDGWIDIADLDRALAAGLQDLGVSVGVERWPAEGTIFDQLRRARTILGTASGTAVLWLVPRGNDSAELYVLPPGSDLGYVRQLELAPEPTERSEAVAAITHGVVQALEDGVPQDLRVVPPEPPPPQSPPEPTPLQAAPSPPPATPSPVRMAIGLHYLGTSLASNAPWHNGPGLELAMHATIGVRIMVAGGVTFGRARDELLPLHLIRLPLQVGAGYMHEFRGRLRLDATAGLDVERLSWSSTSDGVGLDGLQGAHWRLGIGPAVGVGVRIAPGFFLRLGVGMQGWVIDRELAVEVDGSEVTVLDPHPVSASVTAGLHFEFPRAPRKGP